MLFFFCWLWTFKCQMEHFIALEYLSMHLRIKPRDSVKFKMKLYITTVINSFQPLSIFCHTELHLKCCIGLELNITTWSTKILKSIKGITMIDCNLGKIWKTHSPRGHKNISRDFLHYVLCTLSIIKISNGLKWS